MSVPYWLMAWQVYFPSLSRRIVAVFVVFTSTVEFRISAVYIGRAAMSRVGCQLFKIPARSPELNGCENVFNIAASKLRKDALERTITRESYEQFCNRVRQTIEAVPAQTIDRIIESMNGRLRQIIDKNGERLKC